MVGVRYAKESCSVVVWVFSAEIIVLKNCLVEPTIIVCVRECSTKYAWKQITAKETTSHMQSYLIVWRNYYRQTTTSSPHLLKTQHLLNPPPKTHHLLTPPPQNPPPPRPTFTKPSPSSTHLHNTHHLLTPPPQNRRPDKQTEWHCHFLSCSSQLKNIF